MRTNFWREFGGLSKVADLFRRRRLKQGLPDSICAVNSDEKAAILQSGWFDHKYYSNQAKNAQVELLTEAVDHYLRIGRRELLKPNKWFDPGLYLLANPDVQAAGVEPLAHYFTNGQTEGRGLSPQHERQFEDLKSWRAIVDDEGGFDAKFYLRKYLDVREQGLNPWVHYYFHGLHEDRMPNKNFVPSRFVEANPQVLESGIEPLQFFLTRKKEGLQAAFTSFPLPEDIPADVHDLAVTLSESGFFEPDVYVSDSGFQGSSIAETCLHYLFYGADNDFRPAQTFQPHDYLQLNPDVEENAIDPFVHFVLEGFKEGRQTQLGHSSDDSKNWEHEIAVLTESGAFDKDYYVARNNDVVQQKVDPLLHYLERGYSEGRRPNHWFDPTYYLSLYADVKSDGVDPLVHYLVAGKEEGRLPAPALDDAVQLLNANLSVDHKNLFSIEEDNEYCDITLFEDFLIEIQDEEGVIWCLSHDDYTSSVGGVQACILDDFAEHAADSKRFIHFSPSSASALRASSAIGFGVRVIIDGSKLGCFSSTSVIAALEKNAKGPMSDIVIHHTLNFSLKWISDFVRVMKCRSVIFWFHDYFFVCPSITLLRNGVSYCNATSLGSNSCNLCVHERARRNNLDLVNNLLHYKNATYVAPSDFTARFVEKHLELPSHVKIMPHCSLGEESKGLRPPIGRHDVIKVAFLGYDAFHKGWVEWKHIVSKFGKSAGLEFIHLGKRTSITLDDSYKEVQISSSHRQAMLEEIVANEVDIVILWPKWPETFSFTYYEAVAAGCYVVTNPWSGNIADQVKKSGGGIVLNDNQDLYSWFESGEYRSVVSDWRSSGEVCVSSLNFLSGTKKLLRDIHG